MLTRHKGLQDLYLYYRYLWRDINSRDIRRPYVSVDKISDHPYALSIQQWKPIVDTYFDELFDELLTGRGITLPWMMGHIQFVKRKGPAKGFVMENGERKRKTFKNRGNFSYSLLFIWSRKRHCDMAFKFIHRMRLTKHRWRYVWRKINKEPYMIFNFVDSDAI